LHFYLAGINNENFLMRDRETGTWWQQVTGRAIYGPLRGASLELVPSDELTFAEWRNEFPSGRVLAPVGKYAKEYDSKWEQDVAKLPVVLSFPGTELKPRDLVIGVSINGIARAYPWETLVKQGPILDRVNGEPLLFVIGPEGKSFRAFASRIDGREAEFFLQSGSVAQAPKQNGTHSEGGWMLFDTLTGSQWSFQGCAVSGPAEGKCLAAVAILKDYWFDWRNYHPQTTVYQR